MRDKSLNPFPEPIALYYIHEIGCNIFGVNYNYYLPSKDPRRNGIVTVGTMHILHSKIVEFNINIY